LRVAATTYLDEFYLPIRDTGAKITDMSRSTEQRLFGIVVLVGLAALLAAIGMTAVLVRPINRITEGARQLSQGKLDYELPPVGGGEIGQLAKTFNQMARQLRELISQTTSRAASLERRTIQLAAGVAVARAASSILDPQELLQQTVDLICDQFGLYYAGIFLLDKENRFAVLRAGRGEPGRIMLERGHKLEVGGQSMVGWTCAHKQARIALDMGQETVRFANPLLPDTHSEMALPLRVGDRILGALTVQSVQAAAFDEHDIAALQGMADQIATALENARLFSEAHSSLAENQRLVAQVQASLQETTALYEAGQAISTAPDIAAIFQAIVEHGLKPEIDLCLLVLFESYEAGKPNYLTISQEWTRDGVAPGTLRAGIRFAFASFPLRGLLSAGSSGIIQQRSTASEETWESLPPGLQTIAFVPLIVGTRWIGALGLGTPSESALTQAALQPYQAMATQAAAIIENRRLVESTQASLQELSALYRRVTREAWQKALEARPTLTEFEYAPADQAAGGGNTLEMPLTLRGEEIGVVELTSTGRPAWSEQERVLIEAIVTQAALALDSARLFDETQRLAGRERLINEITARIRATTSVPAILQTAARELAQALNVPHAVARIQMKDEG
jgi:GAF domain-containing protein/HAMP domain-containing protein